MKPITKLTIKLTLVMAMAHGGLVAAPAAAQGGALEQRYELNIPKQSLESALQELSRQTGLQIARFSDAIDGRAVVGPVSGTQSAGQALKTLLEPRGLSFKLVSERTIAVVDPKAATEKASALPAPAAGLRVAQGGDETYAAGGVRQDSEPAASGKGIPEILVQGQRTLNMDIKRSRDDTQPYVIFNRDTLVNSGATNLEDFLKQRLTMESTALSESQTQSLLGTRSSVNLRGLGTDQTLILVDGHRMAGVAAVGGIYQPDINGIPLEAIERIEILPTSASGIYGGSATGGVVNIVLRRDYSGVETKLTYDNTFSTDSSKRRIDLNAGATVEGGKTTLLLVGSYSDGNRLLMQDRDFMVGNRQRIYENNPAYFNNKTVPPVGATANIRSTNGSNLILDDLTPLNAPRTYLPAGYAGPSGPAGDGGHALVANAGQYNLGLTDTLDSGSRPMLNVPVVQSLMLTLRREFAPGLQAFVEAGGSNNKSEFAAVQMSNSFTLPADHINNPFTTAIRVVTPLTGLQGTSAVVSEDRRLVTGLIGQLPHNWKMGADVSIDRSRYSGRSVGSTGLAAAAVTAGTLNVMRDVNAYPIDFSQYIDDETVQFPTRASMNDYTVRFSGPLFSLSAGPANLSVLLERREETFKPSVKSVSIGLPPSQTGEQSQDVDSAYIEATLPVVSARNARPGVRDLQVQLAGRWDGYTTSGTNLLTPFDTELVRAQNKVNATNGTLGLRYQPLADLMLRASFATGFLPPAINELTNSVDQFPGFFFFDPVRNESVPGVAPFGLIDLIGGGNAQLKPEKSATASVGLVLTPRDIEGLRISVDWYRIKKRDNIVSPDFFEILADESRFPGRVLRGPPDGDPSGVGPVIGIDYTLMNIAKAVVEGYDLGLDYHLATARYGSFELFGLGTVTQHFQTQTFADSPVIEHVGLVTSQGQGIGSGNYPLKFKGNLGVVWDYRHWKAGWTMRYLDGYRIDVERLFENGLIGGEAGVNQAQGNGGRIPGQTYHDLFVTYRFNAPASATALANVLGDTEWQLGVRNIFNTEPPLDISNTSGFYSGFGDPRLASYYISVKKGF